MGFAVIGDTGTFLRLLAYALHLLLAISPLVQLVVLALQGGGFTLDIYCSIGQYCGSAPMERFDPFLPFWSTRFHMVPLGLPAEG